MNDPQQNDVFFETLARVLIRAFLLGAVLLMVWLFGILIGGDFTYAMHSQWFEISRHDFDVMNYYGMALLKTSLLVFFLLPYISIRWVLWRKKGAD